MSRTTPPIAAIVVNWNRRDDTLRSLAAVDYPALAVILVDNASADDSREAVRAAYPTMRIVENTTNLGFAEGNNVALRLALAEGYPFILLLNNDATIAPDALDLLLRPLLADPRVAISAPAICYLGAPERIWSAGGAIDWRTGEVGSAWCDRPLAALPAAPFAVDHVSGCAMLVRSAAVARAGLLDPRFFMYYEETEWCARITRHGHGIVVVPQARVWHDIAPLAQAGSPAIAYYMTRNHLLFLHAAGAGRGAWARTVARQLRTIGSLFLTEQGPDRVRGRVPMLLALRDFALGRFGPTTLPRMVR
jgi:GT2 family glycosyltransferase